MHRIGWCVDGLYQADLYDMRRVGIVEDGTDEAIRMEREGCMSDSIQRYVGCSLGQGCRYRFIAGERVDFVMEDQRQAGDAQHQQKERAHQTGPGVDERPTANGARGEHGVGLPVKGCAGHGGATVAPGAAEVAVTGGHILLVEQVIGVQRQADAVDVVVDHGVDQGEGRDVEIPGYAIRCVSSPIAFTYASYACAKTK